jgi:hypothetical protein
VEFTVNLPFPASQVIYTNNIDFHEVVREIVIVSVKRVKYSKLNSSGLFFYIRMADVWVQLGGEVSFNVCK